VIHEEEEEEEPGWKQWEELKTSLQLSPESSNKK
jgi:hypothetical protein